MGSGRLIGIILLVAGVLLVVGVVAWGLVNMGGESPALEPGGFVLLLILSGVVAVPLIGGGVFMLRQGAKEEVEVEEAAKQRKILDMVVTQGQVSVNDIVIELQSDTETVQNMVRRLVGMGVLSGYVNWEKGVLYSQDAAALRDLKQCKNCGGDIKLTGKGVVSCPWCGTEYFLN
ncbi:MAG: BlaI/MecI/CopY family transcriptional regulator [Anaerolineae bacterium]|nr:BlaI/MecI/CopY family transcriptional regulator [Anaerolineae bacterium]